MAFDRDLGDEPAPAWRDTAPDILAPIDESAPVSGHVPASDAGASPALAVEHDWTAASVHVFPVLRPEGTHGTMLADVDAWWFMFFYAVSFGGFSGLSSSLTIYFNDDYGLPPVTAGYFTAACVFAGSLVRPLGGVLADRVGGIRSLTLMYTIAALALFTVGTNLPTALSAAVRYYLSAVETG
jgi:nitrate/nitrite transporter NarK